MTGSSGNGPLVTKTLLFVSQGGRGGSTTTERDKTHKLNVFDKATGEWLGMVPLPATPYGNPLTYEHVDPTTVGNRQRILLSDLSGKANVLSKAATIGIEIDKHVVHGFIE